MTRAPRSRLPATAGSRGPAALLVAVLCAVHPAAAAAGATPVDPSPARRPVCIRNICFAAEIAVTAAERSRGLMHRESLAKDHGMLFVFPEEARHRFWMKNTKVALDIIFIGAERRVVGIARRAQPCREEPCRTYGPEANAAYVLEIAGGLSDAYGFATGDLVQFREAAAGR